MHRGLWVVLAATGCAESSLKMGGGDLGAEGAMFADTGNAPADAGEDNGEDPAYWVLSGTLELAGGEIQSALSFVDVEIRGASGSTLCAEGIGIDAASRVVDVPDADVQIWWDVQLASVDTASCASAAVPDVIPEDLFLGLGPLHPEVEAVMSDRTAGLTNEDMVLRSVFTAMHNQEDVWVFGVAGSEAPSTGPTDGVADGVALTEGRWKFQGLYGFPY